VVGLVWLYCLAWMVVLDIVKLRLYRRLDERNTLQSPWLARLKRPLDSFGGLYHRAISGSR